jgi:hypothetical protein
MVKKFKINDKSFTNFIIVAFIVFMVIWVRVQGANMFCELQDVINRNTMSATEFMMRLSLFH